MTGLSNVRHSIKVLTSLIECENPLLHQAERSVEDDLFAIFLSNGMHITNAREWARIITKELKG